MNQDHLPTIEIHETRHAMGASAARHFTQRLAAVLERLDTLDDLEPLFEAVASLDLTTGEHP